MEVSLVASVVDLLENAFGYEAGSPGFNLAMGLSVGAWVIAARIFMVMLSTSRGIVAAFLACIVSLAAGLFGYVGVELYVLPYIEADWGARILPIAGLSLSVLVSIFVVTKRILNVSAGITIFIYIVATMVAVCAHFGMQISTGLMDAGGGQVEERERRVQEEMDSIY